MTLTVNYLATERDYYKAQVEQLLKAAQRVEAHSHWNNDVYGYVVDELAMTKLCQVIGKIK